MKLESRSYSTKFKQPTPLIHNEADGSFFVALIPWGDAQLGHGILDEIVRFINSARMDVEVTSPYDYLTCYTPEQNYSRNALLMANELVYRKENSQEYNFGFEAIIIIKKEHQIAWAKAGNWNGYVLNQKKINPFCVRKEFVLPNLAPLPLNVLGVDSSCDIETGTLNSKSLSELVLIYSQYSDCLNKVESCEIQKLAYEFSKIYLEQPFWISICNPNS